MGSTPEGTADWVDFTPLWGDVGAIVIPTLFVRGDKSPFVLDEDVAEMRRRLPALEISVVEDAGHAVQSDRPLELARLIRQFALS
jgi:pimeloyl-ACP methyl ester carboxylesterase